VHGTPRRPLQRNCGILSVDQRVRDYEDNAGRHRYQHFRVGSALHDCISTREVRSQNTGLGFKFAVHHSILGATFFQIEGVGYPSPRRHNA